MQTGGAGGRAVDPPVGGRPASPPEPQGGREQSLGHAACVISPNPSWNIFEPVLWPFYSFYPSFPISLESLIPHVIIILCNMLMLGQLNAVKW